MADALLVVSVGGPEGPDEVYPFLNNILKGSRGGVPEERLKAVAERYMARGGISPANHEVRKIISSLETLLQQEGPDIPVYLGIRFSHPYLAETLEEMKSSGIKSALAFVTSPYGSDFSCWNYRKAMEEARLKIGKSAPRIKKLRLFFNHPCFIKAQASRLEEAVIDSGLSKKTTPLIFTAHSLPTEYAATSLYEKQIRESCSLIAQLCGITSWTLAFQSRSGHPSQPWLGPTPETLIKNQAKKGARDILLMPVGFMYDNMEIIYDLDEEAAGLASSLGIHMVRVNTAGNHPDIIRMIHKLILEQTRDNTEREFMGNMGAADDDCLNCLCRKN
jgi:protoporphyrin/coproporphyrin ferrochelatase